MTEYDIKKIQELVDYTIDLWKKGKYESFSKTEINFCKKEVTPGFKVELKITKHI